MTDIDMNFDGELDAQMREFEQLDVRAEIAERATMPSAKIVQMSDLARRMIDKLSADREALEARKTVRVRNIADGASGRAAEIQKSIALHEQQLVDLRAALKDTYQRADEATEKAAEEHDREIACIDQMIEAQRSVLSATATKIN